jgi:uncharacterized protein YndB with AHSA1/START domain
VPAVADITFTGRFPWDRQRVFTYLFDPTNWPEFIPGFGDVSGTQDWGEVGGTCRGAVTILGRSKPVTFELLEVEPGERFRYRSRQAGLPDAEHIRVLHDEGGGTRLEGIVRSDDRGGVPGLLDRVLFRPAVQRKMDQAMRNAEALMAAGPAGSADGA